MIISFILYFGGAVGHRDYTAKTPVEIARDFTMAFDRLARAGQAYDAGHHSDALTIAALVYLFVHDHGKSTVSLLSLTKRKGNIVLCDTGTQGQRMRFLA
jgi:hypothetical protein